MVEKEANTNIYPVTDLPVDRAVVSFEPYSSILNQNLGVSWDRQWTQDATPPSAEENSTPVGGLSPTPERTPQPASTVGRRTRTPQPTATATIQNSATPTEQATPTPPPTATEPGGRCNVTDLKGVLNDEGNHFEQGRVVDGYVENVSTNPECPKEVKIWVYGSTQYPETEGWLESQHFLFGFNGKVQPGTRKEISQEIPETDYKWCQVDLVRADVPPRRPPEPPYLNGDKMIDYVFVACGREEEPKPTKQPTEAPTELSTPTGTPTVTETPLPLLPTGNPPTQENPDWDMIGYGILVAGTGVGCAGYLWRRRQKKDSLSRT